MPRRAAWTMSPGETLVLAKSLGADLEDDASLTGETPAISVWELAADETYDEVATGFTVSGETVNAAALTTESGETIAIGEAAVFTLAVATTVEPGRYYVKVECDADDGTHPVSRVPLTIEGP